MSWGGNVSIESREFPSWGKKEWVTSTNNGTKISRPSRANRLLTVLQKYSKIIILQNVQIISDLQIFMSDAFAFRMLLLDLRSAIRCHIDAPEFAQEGLGLTATTIVDIGCLLHRNSTNMWKQSDSQKQSLRKVLKRQARSNNEHEQQIIGAQLQTLLWSWLRIHNPEFYDNLWEPSINAKDATMSKVLFFNFSDLKTQHRKRLGISRTISFNEDFLSQKTVRNCFSPVGPGKAGDWSLPRNRNRWQPPYCQYTTYIILHLLTKC